MKYEEFTALSDVALVHRELQLERDLMELRFRLKTNQLENTASIRMVRKDIARARTAQRVREKSQDPPLGPNTLRTRHRNSFTPGSSGVLDSAAGFLTDIAGKMGGGKDD